MVKNGDTMLGSLWLCQQFAIENGHGNKFYILFGEFSKSGDPMFQSVSQKKSKVSESTRMEVSIVSHLTPIFSLPSGNYGNDQQFAMENGHRNSGCSHEKL